MTGAVSVNEFGDRNEDYAVYDFRGDASGNGTFVRVGHYDGFKNEYLQKEPVSYKTLT